MANKDYLPILNLSVFVSVVSLGWGCLHIYRIVEKNNIGPKNNNNNNN